MPWSIRSGTQGQHGWGAGLISARLRQGSQHPHQVSAPDILDAAGRQAGTAVGIFSSDISAAFIIDLSQS